MKKKSKLPVQQNGTLKFQAWAGYFLDAKNKETFGNATKAALKVYDTQDYNSASQIGYENLRRLENRSASILEQLGYTFAELMKIGMAKMVEGDYDDWEHFMEKLGFFAERKQPGNYMQNNFDLRNLSNAINQSATDRGLKP